MKIKLDLSGELEEKLPARLSEAYSVAEGTSLADLVGSLPFTDRIALTSVNGTMVPPTERADKLLKEGDEVMMLPPIKGG